MDWKKIRLQGCRLVKTKSQLKRDHQKYKDIFVQALMLEYLKKPYPCRDPTKKELSLALVTGIFVGLFLFLFRPFGLHELTSPLKIFLILGYGVITFFVSAVFLYFIPTYFSKIQDERSWTVGKEIIYMNCMILAIAGFNTLYTPVLSPYNVINLPSFLYMIMNTFLVGIIPISFLIFHEHNQLLLRHVTESESIDLPEKNEIQNSVNPILIKSGSENLEIIPDQLLYVESIGNYTNIKSLIDEKLVTISFRSTMKNLEPQIQNSYIVRCHRSYFVNLNKVTSVKGNAQGFKLSLKDSEEVVPVSRKYVPIIKAFFAKK